MSLYRICKRYLGLGSLLLIASCVSISTPSQREAAANKLAEQKGWHAQHINTQKFDLVSYAPVPMSDESVLTIYIEGDGLAWHTRSTPSADPTPINPIGLKLALAHPSGNAGYLARPCQYVGGAAARGCSKAYWTNKRFAKEVIKASDEALTILKLKFGARHLQLVGYSGGGAVAALLAAQRDDVTLLVTVAGNLDHQVWTEANHISPLDGSLNPADYWQALTEIQQVHFVGENDLIIGTAIAASYRQNFCSPHQIKIITLPNIDHHCCWVKPWPTLWKTHVRP